MDGQRKAEGPLSLRYLQLLDKVKGNSTCREAEEDEVTAMKAEGTALPF